MKVLKKNMSVSECIDVWLKNEHNYIKESTYSLYLTIIENHLKTYFKRRRINTISNRDFQSFILDKLNCGRLDGRGGLSRKTVKDMVILLKSVLKFAIENKVMERIDFNFKIPKREKIKKVEVFTLEERMKICEYVKSNLCNKTLGILICLCTGLRIGEICALKWADVDFGNEIINVNHTIQRIYINTTKKSKIIISPPKTESSKRKIPIAAELITVLKKFKSNNNFYVISGKEKYIEPRTYRKFFKKMLNILKISKLKFHSLRHTFATQAIENDVDYKTVSEILGHASVGITLNLYVHPDLEHKKTCLNKIFNNMANPILESNL